MYSSSSEELHSGQRFTLAIVESWRFVFLKITQKSLYSEGEELSPAMNQLLLIILIAVIGPVIGSLVGVLTKPTKKFMFNILSFAGGVMLAISFLELIPESIELSSTWVCIIGVVFGSIVMYLIDRLMPEIHPEHHADEDHHHLKKTALYLVIGIFLHNFPEGIAIAVGAVTDLKLSIVIALAIAIHDIPEGICTSAPYYYVTKDRLRSFLVSASTLIPTIVGFGFAYYLFQNIPKNVIGFLIAATAGLMIHIAGHELVPASSYKVTEHSTIFSFMAGVVTVILLGMLH